MADDVCISTDFVDDKERSDFWREVTRPVFETLPFEEDRGQPLNGSVRSRIVGSLMVGATTFNRQRYHRDRRLVAQSGLDHYLLQVLTSGCMRGDFNGVDVRAGVGDICVLDLAQPLKSEVEAGASLSIVLPRPLLDKAVGTRSLHGSVLRANWPMTPLIAACVRGLCELSAPLPDAQALAAQEAVVTLLSAALKGVGPGEVVCASAVGSGLRQRIVEFITRNVFLLELSPEFLCRRFNVSRAHLYRAFAADGGVAKVLRDARLDAAYGELTQTARAPRSITEIAYSLGFSSSNQLLRSFRSRFGVTPREARSAADAPSRKAQGLDLQAYFADLSGKTGPSAA